MRCTAGTPFVREFVTHMMTRHTEVLVENSKLSSDAIRRAVRTALDAGCAGGGDMYPSLYLLFDAIRKGSAVAL